MARASTGASVQGRLHDKGPEEPIQSMHFEEDIQQLGLDRCHG